MRTRRRRLADDSLDERTDSGRWMVSYADFITLLFAFFVVMYSISSVNDGKFRVLSNALVTEFGEPAQRPVPIDLGAVPTPKESEGAKVLSEIEQGDQDSFELEVKPFDLDPDAELGERIAAAIEPLVEDPAAKVRDGQQWLHVELPSELLFASGRAALNASASPVISRMAHALREVNTPIRVEGFTDDVPIRGGQFGSNWELSAARAAALVNYLASDGIDPKLMSAIGFGEFHPVAENSTDEGRANNRRVVIAIAKTKAVGLGGPVQGEVDRIESLPSRTLQRITRLPGALGIL